MPTSPPLARALAERHYDQPTPVQTAVLAPEAAGRDLLVSAQTGSGKTVAYGLGMAPTILGEADVFGKAAEPASRRERSDWDCAAAEHAKHSSRRAIPRLCSRSLKILRLSP